MPVQHKKEYGVYHWDTFDNETLLLFETDDKTEADDFIVKRYKEQGRIAASGADKVEIVDSKGKILTAFNVC